MSQQTTPTIPRELPAELLSETFLLEMMKENLNQARHAENERMMFVTLFAALVGGLLALSAETGDAFFSSITILLLFVLNTVCYVLTRRWNDVFKAHWSIACQIGCYLSERDPSNGYNPDFSAFNSDDFWANYKRTNRYFCFNNRLHRPKQKHYVHTASLFSLFNLCIYVLLTLSLIYVNLNELQQLF